MSNLRIMKKAAFYIAIIALGLIGACDTGQIECFRASTTIVTESRNPKDFKGVVFNSLGDIYLIQGSEYSFTIKGPENVVELITSEVEGEVLVIGTTACFNGVYDLSIEITAPEFKYINLAGAGSITVVDQLVGDILEMEMFGTGEIEADAYVDSLYTTITGTGIVSYTGEALKHEVSSSGLFELNSYDLQTNHTNISITGEGDCYVTAMDKLDVLITGKGNVYYKGQPTVDSDIQGTGAVIDSN